jgi:hypothetical protein
MLGMPPVDLFPDYLFPNVNDECKSLKLNLYLI